ncbi:YgfZ/GcvT domain-containing protein [Falsihalocynthiibacter sp. SS001]|uniref:CAF17-like 4Fe-4S cluster assembly/insertion protein YgfZ n=1 Tax=Falsihalocynthiibacter sp. SS001 TaxID=3349698 RepID=UPI0036D4051C
MTQHTRKIFTFSGADRVDFLQGLVTNDVTRSGLVYAALLTPQGKYIADFFLLRRENDILLDVSATLADALAQRLTMYKLRADVSIAASDLAVSCGLGDTPEGAFADPRNPALGWRCYGEGSEDIPDMTALRVAHCVPETGIELTLDTYILEAGFERLNGVDFKKGCYVGQEVTARMKHKTELRKGLATVSMNGSAEIGTPITSEGKAVGTLYSQAEGRAIAYLRFDRATGQMEADGATITYP